MSENPTHEQARQLGNTFTPGKTAYPVRLGQEYVVLGLGTWGGVHWIEIEMSTEDIVSVPLFLFEIVEGTPSRLWQTKVHADGALTLWPTLFYEEFFVSKVSDAVPEALSAYRELKQRLLLEMELPHET